VDSRPELVAIITMQKHMNLVAVGEDNAVIQSNATII